MQDSDNPLVRMLSDPHQRHKLRLLLAVMHTHGQSFDPAQTQSLTVEQFSAFTGQPETPESLKAAANDLASVAIEMPT